MTIAADPGDGGGLCRGRAARARGRARRRRAARRERLPDHAVPQLGDQRSQGRIRRLAREPRAVRARHRPRDPRAGRRRLPPADEDQRRRITTTRVAFFGKGPSGNTRRGVAAGVPLARGCRRRRDSRVHRQLLPAPAQPGRRRSARSKMLADDLRRADLERRARVPQLPALPEPARSRAPAVERRGAAGRTRSKGRTCPTRGWSSRRSPCR